MSAQELGRAPAASRNGTAGILSPTHRPLTLGIVALEALYAFEALGVVTAMPTVARSLDGLGFYAMAFACTLAASVLGLVDGGRRCDRDGVRPTLRLGIGAFAAGLVVAGLAPSMPVFLLGRLAQGYGGGLLSVALYVAVAQAYPARLHPRIFAAFSSAWVVPAIVGPGIAGLVVEHLHWRWLFLGVSLLVLAATPLVLAPLARSRPAPGPASTGSKLGWATVAALAALAVHEAGHLPLPWAMAAQAIPILAVAASVRHLLPAGTLRAARGLPAVIALRGLASAAFFGVEAFLPLLLSQQRGLSPAQAGMVLTVGAVGWFCGSWTRSRLHDPSPTRVLATGAALMMAGIALTATALDDRVPLAVPIIGWTLAGLGIGLTRPTLAVLTLALSPPGQQGSSSASLQLFDALVTACVLAISGAVLAATLDTRPALAHATGFGLSLAFVAGGWGLASRVGVRPGT